MELLALIADIAYSADQNRGNIRSSRDSQTEHPLIKYDHSRTYVDKME